MFAGLAGSKFLLWKELMKETENDIGFDNQFCS